MTPVAADAFAAPAGERVEIPSILGGLAGALDGDCGATGVIECADGQLAGSLAIGSIEVDRPGFHIANRCQFHTSRPVQAEVEAARRASFGDHSLGDRESSWFQLAEFAERVLNQGAEAGNVDLSYGIRNHRRVVTPLMPA